MRERQPVREQWRTTANLAPMSTTVAALRGATTLDGDEREHMLERVARAAHRDDGAQRGRPRRPDLDPVHRHRRPPLRVPGDGRPAAGLGDVPLICARELDIDGGMPRCIRVMMHITTDRPRSELRPRVPGGRTIPPRRPPGMISARTESGPRRAQIVGTGLIGGSIGLGLRRLGWHVTGDDLDVPQCGACPRARLPSTRRAPTPTPSSPSSPPRSQRDPRRPRGAGPRRHRHRRRQREGARRRGARATPASSAATRWPAPRRWASTAPGRPVRAARRGC